MWRVDSPDWSRRDFVLGIGSLAASLLPSTRLLAAGLARASEIKFGYASITWVGNDLQAIDDIASLGFRGIQLRSTAVSQFGTRPSELRDLLAQHRLTMVALSSGNVTLDPARERQMIDEHVSHAKFMRDVGGLYLQVIDERPAGRPITRVDFRRLGALLTKIGQRTADLGIPLGYHHHMGSLGERPGDIERILGASDPRFVRLVLDTAHYRQGGGDPAQAIRRHADRLLFLHIKDVQSPAPGGVPRSYRFVELGRGKVDFASIFKALDDVSLRGWAIIELDAVPNRARTPKESALISRRFLEEKRWLRPD